MPLGVSETSVAKAMASNPNDHFHFSRFCAPVLTRERVRISCNFLNKTPLLLSSGQNLLFELI